jgi:maltokinase
VSATRDQQLASLLPDFLVRQRWYAGDGSPASVDIVDAQPLVPEGSTPGLLWVLAHVPGDDGVSYQVPVGFRPLDTIETWLEGKGRSLIGDVDGDDGTPLLAYDAMIDPDLVPVIFDQVAPGVVADQTTRALAVEQSNTSVIVGEQAVLKLFRRVHDGPNPDAEIVDALHGAGFEATPRPLGTWRRDGRDLAVARSFVPGSADGWSLALTSLRDLYDRRLPPEECGGDFAFDAQRLGGLVAQLHLALAAAFGRSPGDAAAWAEVLRAGLVDLGPDSPSLRDAASARYDLLAAVADPGPALRVHGDLHLGQLLRNDEGWFVLDFEGEPRVPLADRRVSSSPLRDVAGMLRSFHYASEAGLLERHEAPDDDLQALAQAWEDRNASAFLGGYLNEPGIDELLPADDRDLHVVLGAFELGKAVYEVGYERDHRPDWLPIPMRAVRRMLT